MGHGILLYNPVQHQVHPLYGDLVKQWWGVHEQFTVPEWVGPIAYSSTPLIGEIRMNWHWQYHRASEHLARHLGLPVSTSYQDGVHTVEFQNGELRLDGFNLSGQWQEDGKTTHINLRVVEIVPQ